MHRTRIIGIAGPTCSGKTSIAALLARNLPRAELLPIDSYYRNLAALDPRKRDTLNFDHPDAIDYPLLLRHLNTLMEGRSVQRPLYDFATHSRTTRTVEVTPGNYLIVEGLFVFCWKAVRDVLDYGIFIDLDDRESLRRRVRRDTTERNRSRESVISQYRLTVKPMYETHVAHTKIHADLVINGRQTIEDSVVAILRKIPPPPERPPGHRE